MKHFSHIAMATLFELWLCGQDAVHLRSIAFKAWEEVDRLERLMSRYDPRAELARVNREAPERAVRIEIELFDILEDCLRWSALTDGYFDVAFGTHWADTSQRVPFALNHTTRTITFNEPGVKLDLGAYGKGYAVDRIAELLRNYGIDSAFIQAGHSSAFALGRKADGYAWRVDVPHFMDPEAVLFSQPLTDEGFSYSATHDASSGPISDIVNPHDHTVVASRGACWIVTPTALQAEVLTTALLAMGREKAGRFIQNRLNSTVEVGWI